MARPLSVQQYQSLVSHWRSALAGLKLTASAAANRRAVAKLLQISAGKLKPALRQRFEAATESLWPALAAAQHAESPDVRPDALDGWIERHLITSGPDLLITREARLQAMAHIRDRRRRAHRGDDQTRSARIAMAQADWAALQQVRRALAEQAAADGRPERHISLGMALAYVVRAHVQGIPPARTAAKGPGYKTRKPARRDTTAPPDELDLFSRTS